MTANGYTGNPPGGGEGGGGSVAWADITGKPSTFTPAAHTQATSTITGLDDALADRATDAELTAGLATKAATSHTHAEGDVTGLTGSLAGKAASSHTHTIANVTSLQTALDGKADDADVTALDGRVDTLETNGPFVFAWDGDSYNFVAGSITYIGPVDPGAIADGSIWIDTSA
jgi:hypothetical protein